MSSNKKSLKLKKGGAFEYAKMFQESLSPCANKQKGGDQPINTYVDYSQDWHYQNQKNISHAVDSSVGINEYQFARTTPDNKFIVATGLVKNKTGIEMTGGRKTKKSVVKKSKKSTKKVSKKSKPSSSKKVVKKVKKVVKKAVKKVESSVKKAVKKVKKSVSSKKSKSKTSTSKKVKKSKSTKTPKSKSMLNKTKNALKSVGKKVSSLFSKK